MNLGLMVLLAVVAGIAGSIAVVAGSNVGVVVPAASVTVAAGAALLVGVLERTRWPALRAGPRRMVATARVRHSFEAGPFGRRELLDLLDQLERASAGMGAKSLSPEEVARVQSLPPVAFREYLDGRISDLERRT